MKPAADIGREHSSGKDSLWQQMRHADDGDKPQHRAEAAT